MIDAILAVLYFPFDILLGWLGYLPPVVSISLAGVLSGVAVMLFQKHASRQDLLAQCKADLKLLKQKAKAARQAGDPDTARRLQGLIGRISGKYMGGALKPALWTVPLIGIVALWVGARLGFLPVRPGDVVEVVAHFEDGATGFAHVVPHEGLRPAGAAIARVEIPQGALGPQASWKVRAGSEGAFPLRLRHADRTYEVPIQVLKRGGRSPEPVTVFNTATATQDQLQAVELKLAPSLPPAWWNLTFQWAGLYLAVALVVALILRFAWRIQ